MIFYSEEQIWSGIISDKWHQVHLYTFCRAVSGRCIGSSNPGLPPVITMPVSPSPSVYSNHPNPSRFHYSPEPYLVVFSNFDIDVHWYKKNWRKLPLVPIAKNLWKHSFKGAFKSSLSTWNRDDCLSSMKHSKGYLLIILQCLLANVLLTGVKTLDIANIGIQIGDV